MDRRIGINRKNKEYIERSIAFLVARKLDKLLIVFVLFFVMLILYMIVHFSMERHREAQAYYYQRVEELDWLRRNLPAVRGDKTLAGQEISNGQNFLALVANSAKRNNLNLSRFQPEGTNAVSVILDKASYSDLVIWMDGLLKNHNVRLRQVILENNEGMGLVDAHITLEVF